MLLSALAVFIGMILGRMTGLGREVLIASNYGISGQADIAVLLLVLPDVFINFLIGGAMGAALIPSFQSLDDVRSRVLFFQASTITAIIFSALALLIAIFPLPLVHMVSPGMAESAKASVIQLMRIAVWVIPFSALAAITTAYMQARERFLLPSMGTFIFNTCIIIALLVTTHLGTGLELFAYAIVIGAVLRWLSQLSLSVFKRVSLVNLFIAHDRGVMVRYFQAMIASGCVLFYPVITMALASYSMEGSIATVNYVNKFVQLPLGLFLSIFCTVLLPRLSRLSVGHKDKQLKQLAQESAGYLMVLAVILTCTLLLFTKPLLQLLFSYGAMSTVDNDTFSSLAAIAVISIPAQGLVNYIISIFNANKMTSTPFYLSIFGLITYFLLAKGLCPFYGIEGLMIAYSLSFYLMLIVFSIFLSIQLDIKLYKSVCNFKVLALVFLYACFAILLKISTNYYPKHMLSQLMLMLSVFLCMTMCAISMNKSIYTKLLEKLKRSQ